MNWFYVDGGQQAGPVDDAQLETLRRNGKIQPDTLVWHEGMANWEPYSTVRPEGPPTAAASTPPPAGGTAAAPGPALGPNQVVCAQCGKVYDAENTIQYGNMRVCAACKPVFMQKLAEGASLDVPGTMRYAGFWIRVGAKFVDGLILGVVFFVPAIIIMAKNPPDYEASGGFRLMEVIIQLIYIFANMVYQIFFLGKYGATPGKMACKIHVITAEGQKIGYGRATGRFFAEMLSAILCYIGYIVAAFDSQKRALHDHICNTRVVYK